MKKTSPQPVQIVEPKRQGYYNATLQDGSTVFAEWREYDKKEGKRWWKFVGDEPTQEKTREPLDGVTGFEPVTAKAVDAFFRRELTLDEKLDEAYKGYLSLETRGIRYDCPIPPERQVQVGDALEIGFLRDVTVVQLRDEGRIVLYSFRDINHNYGSPIDNGIKYRAQHWTEVIPAKHVQKVLRTQRPRMHDSYRSSSLDSVVYRVLRGVDDHPDYQRGYAWTAKDKELFLDSLFAGRDIGRFIFVKRPFPKSMQVMDGKQRLNCLVEFITSQLEYRGAFWHQLSPGDRDRIMNHSVQFVDLDEAAYSREDLLQIFLDVNAAGVPQTEEHLEFVRRELEAERAKKAAQAASNK